MAEDPPTVAEVNSTQRLYDGLPVSAQCIRLLRIHAADGSSTEDAPLRCEIYVADLTTRPIYTALSYVWGERASPPDLVFCNGVPFPVTRNCYSALQQLQTINGTKIEGLVLEVGRAVMRTKR